MIKNKIENVRVTFSTYITSDHFKRGVETARKGESWPAEYNTWNESQQTRFERGRLFGTIAPKKMRYIAGRGATKEAVNFIRQNYQEIAF